MLFKRDAGIESPKIIDTFLRWLLAWGFSVVGVGWGGLVCLFCCCWFVFWFRFVVGMGCFLFVFLLVLL